MKKDNGDRRKDKDVGYGWVFSGGPFAHKAYRRKTDMIPIRDVMQQVEELRRKYEALARLVDQVYKRSPRFGWRNR